MQQLVKGPAKDAHGAWRLPTPEIEATLAAEVTKILSEPATIAKLVARAKNDRGRGEAVKRVQALRARLKADDTRAAALRDIIGRVELCAEALEIEITVKALLPNLALSDENVVLRRRASSNLKRRGVETRLAIGGIERRAAGADPALIRLLSRAVSWWESIEAGEASIERIAKREQLSERYLRDVLQLAFLDPDIVKEIVSGAQDDNLCWSALMSHPVLPLRWREQFSIFESD